MKLFILISGITLALSRPQDADSQFENKDKQQIQEQEIVEVEETQPQTFLMSELQTKTLKNPENIEQISEQHGLINQSIRLSKHTLSQNHEIGSSKHQERKINVIETPSYPFTSAVSKYIGNNVKPSVSVSNNINMKVNDKIPNHYIKSTPHQTVILPASIGSTNFDKKSLHVVLNPVREMKHNEFANHSQQYDQAVHDKSLNHSHMPSILISVQNEKQSTLKKKAVENIGNFIGDSQFVPIFNSPYWNPYTPIFTIMPFLQTTNLFSAIRNVALPKTNFDSAYQLVETADINVIPKARYLLPPDEAILKRLQSRTRQWQGEFSQHAPFLINGPLHQIVSATKSVFECDQQTKETNCKDKGGLREGRQFNMDLVAKNKAAYQDYVDSSMPELAHLEDKRLEIQDLAITEDALNPITFQVNFKSPRFDLSDDTDTIARLTEQSNQNEMRRLNTKQPQFTNNHPYVKLHTIEKESPEYDEISDLDVQKDFLTHKGQTKNISKDNIGNGVFVHRIKVRKGGVAIAGPGGIATAGSGGTAIVGPNGFAYTHPDSLAIAGSGAKVFAVNPEVNLSEIFANGNKVGRIPSRLGKIVAIGPVVYYNKG